MIYRGIEDVISGDGVFYQRKGRKDVYIHFYLMNVRLFQREY